MELEQKGVKFDVEDIDDEAGSFTAYASTFGNRDLAYDIVVKGAFQTTLAENRKIQMCWNHDKSVIVGIFDEIREDDYGLWVSGKFANTLKGQECRELCRIGAIDSLSIGYYPIKYDFTSTGERLLQEVSLLEISLVPFPCNPMAQISSVKTAFQAAFAEEQERKAAEEKAAFLRALSTFDLFKQH